MRAQIDLFYKFTRKADKILKIFLRGCFRTDELGGVGPYFAPGPGEERIYRLELDVEWVGEE